jgi:hypothetical protein
LDFFFSFFLFRVLKRKVCDNLKHSPLHSMIKHHSIFSLYQSHKGNHWNCWIQIPCNWYCMAAIPTFYLLIFFTFMYVYHFTLLTLLLFFIQRLRLKVNFLTFNLSPSKELQSIQYPRYCMDLNPKLLCHYYKPQHVHLKCTWRTKHI